MCYKKSCGSFYHDLKIKPSRPISVSLLRRQFILGKRTDKHNYKKSHSSTKKHYLKLTGRFVGKKLKAKLLQPELQSWHDFGLQKLFFRFSKEKLLC